MICNKKLFMVTCCGNNGYLSVKSRDSIYVIALDEEQASLFALNKMKELEYDLIDDYVSKVELIADEKETNNSILIINKLE